MRRGCHGAEPLSVAALDLKLEECLIKNHKVQQTGACGSAGRLLTHREHMRTGLQGCHVPGGPAYTSLCYDFRVAVTQL